MKLRSKSKILLFLLAVCFVFSVFFAETMIAAEYNHDCTGEGCRVCLQIEVAQYFLKTLKFAGIGLFLAVCLAFSVQIPKKPAHFTPFLSPVTLKVRFNS
jgi:ABC-type spermidine/putrescine transport system permease subunit I